MESAPNFERARVPVANCPVATGGCTVAAAAQLLLLLLLRLLPHLLPFAPVLLLETVVAVVVAAVVAAEIVAAAVAAADAAVAVVAVPAHLANMHPWLWLEILPNVKFWMPLDNVLSQNGCRAQFYIMLIA